MEKYYIYEGHLGGYFWTLYELGGDYDEDGYDALYCESCGDSDWEVGVLELDHEPSEAEMEAFAEKENS